jgi:hypothetical protein
MTVCFYIVLGRLWEEWAWSIVSHRDYDDLKGRFLTHVHGMVYICGEQAQFDAFEKLGNSG